MSQRVSDIFVSVVLIACTAVVLFALTRALADRAPAHGRTVEIDFPDVAGIAVHSEVRYAGLPVGLVTAMRPLSLDERRASAHPSAAVRVSVGLAESAPELRADARAGIGSDTLLSEKYVTLTAGSAEQPPLAVGTVLRGDPAFNVDTIAAKIDPLLREAERLLASMRKTVEEIGPQVSGAATSVQSAVASAKIAIESADGALKRADALIADNKGEVNARLVELRSVIEGANRGVAGAQQLLGNADGFVSVTERQLRERMAELAVILQNLKVVTTHAKAVTETLGTNPSKLIWGGKRNDLTPEEQILRSDAPVPAKRPPPVDKP
jgi:ABC-type transporter Mla subunit MlaD